MGYETTGLGITQAQFFLPFVLFSASRRPLWGKPVIGGTERPEDF